MTMLDLPRLGRRRYNEGRELLRLPAEQLVAEATSRTGDMSLRRILSEGAPQPGQSREVNTWRARNLPNLWRGARQVLTARALDIPTMYGSLWINVFRADGTETAYGLASLRVVTTAGCNYIVSNGFISTGLVNMKYHGVGTGTNAEASSDTALQTELTTAYNPANTRATGSQGTGGSANIYSTTGTNTVQATAAITEHGIFTVATSGSGTLLDRSVFSVVNLVSGDSIQTPYSFTATAGG